MRAACCKVVRALLAASFVLVGAPRLAHAGLVNDVPSCYAANKIAQQSLAYDKLLYVLIDQTVELDATLQKSVLDNSLGALTPGTKFVIAEFSAFSQGHYLNVVHTGIIERPIAASQEGDVVMSRLRDFHTCLAEQLVFARRMALGTADQIMKSSTTSLAQSDIMMALKTVSSSVAEDKAPKRAVLIVTDGLENSSITSFYANNAVRDINPTVELKKAEDNHLFGDFRGARVFVVGAGTMAPATNGSGAVRNGYRNPQVLMDLQQFWGGYFSHSNASLVQFGEPALLEPLSY